MSEQTIFHKIESYLSGQMSEQDHRAFVDEMTKDPKLKELVNRHQMTDEALEYQVEKELRDHLRSWQSDHHVGLRHATLPKPKTLTLRLTQLAAAVALLVLGLFWYGNSFYGRDALVDRYHRQPISPSVRVAEAQTPNNYRQGLDAMANRDWQKAISSLSSIPSDSAYFLSAQYFLAHSYYGAGQFENAEKIFTNYRSLSANHQESAQWMHILTLIKLEADGDLIEQSLQQISQESTHAYYEMATRLQSDLNRFWTFWH